MTHETWLPKLCSRNYARGIIQLAYLERCRREQKICGEIGGDEIITEEILTGELSS